MKKIILFISLILASCNTEIPTSFSEKALNETFTTLNETEITFKEILNKYKGKKIVIDIWASWCGDCIKGMPKVVKLQKENPDVLYLFLSLDKSIKDWKLGIEKYHVKGEHYFLNTGYKSDFSEFVNIDWIPRYMVIDESGVIEVFKAVEADDARIVESLKK